jgi:hypothetical protein
MDFVFHQIINTFSSAARLTEKTPCNFGPLALRRRVAPALLLSEKHYKPIVQKILLMRKNRLWHLLQKFKSGCDANL